ncbi:MAG: ferredoxin--NADP reductase [Candidatus Krumholzibacteriia bacterium]
MTTDLEALRREHYDGTVLEVERPRESLMVLRVRPDGPIPKYEAGQWTLLGLGMWEPRCAGCPEETLSREDALAVTRRPYSLSCSILAGGEDRLLRPQEEGGYEFFLALAREQATGTQGAALTARLFALEPGCRLWVAEHPQGSYTLAHVQPDHDVMFLATGTGEAPHNRMIWELLRRGHRGRIASVVTVRELADLAYGPVHERLMKRFPSYRYVAVATREPGVEGSRLQEMLQSGALEERAGMRLDPERCHVFLCGSPGMLGRPRQDAGRRVYPQPPGMIELLEQRGLRADPPEGAHIHFERY